MKSHEVHKPSPAHATRNDVPVYKYSLESRNFYCFCCTSSISHREHYIEHVNDSKRAALTSTRPPNDPANFPIVDQHYITAMCWSGADHYRQCGHTYPSIITCRTGGTNEYGQAICPYGFTPIATFNHYICCQPACCDGFVYPLVQRWAFAIRDNNGQSSFAITHLAHHAMTAHMNHRACNGGGPRPYLAMREQALRAVGLDPANVRA